MGVHFAFIPNVTIDAFAAGTVTYDVENQAGINPVWMTIEIDTGVVGVRTDNTTYQFVPTTNPSGWHTVDAGSGQWQKWNNGAGDISGNPLISLNDIATAHAGLDVVRTYLRLGMGDSYYNGGTGTIAWVDKTTFGGKTYDFQIIPTCNTGSFDTFTLGSVNSQGGWGVTGPYDQAIVDNVYGYSNFGCKSLRLSNSITSGSFGDQTFSFSNSNEAGEASATNNGFSGGTRQNHFEAQFDIASTISTQQSGLSVSISPDRGDGSRMSYLRFDDNSGGIDVTFYDVQGTSNPANFVPTIVATNLTRTIPHTVKYVMDFVDGPSNDIVKIYIDGTLVHTGTSWENYYRYDSEASAEQNIRTIDSLLFRASGAAVPATSGNGFLFDNINLVSSTILPDTTAPAVPTLLSPIDGVYRHTSDSNFSDWNDVSDPSGVTYRYQSASDIEFTHLYYDSMINGSSPGQMTESMIMNPGEPEVSYYWRVQACDTLGNCSDWTTPWRINIDNTNPTVPTLVSPNNNEYLATHNFNFQWGSSTDSSPLTYEWESSYQQTTKTDDSFTSQLAHHSNLSTSVNSPGTPDNIYYWHVRAVDAAGNTSGWSNIWKVTVDTVAPTVPTGIYFKDTVNDKNVVCGGITSARNFDVYWNNNPESDIDHYEYISFNADGSAGPVRTFTTPYFNASWWTVPIEGIYGVQIKAVDKAGNKSNWFGGSQGRSNSCTYTADWTAPIAPVITAPTNEYFRNTPITANWTAVTDTTGISKYQVGYVYNDHHTFSGSTCSDLPNGGCRDVAGNTTSRNHSPNTSEEGGVTIYVRAIDGAGNVGAWSSPVYYIYDATVPTTPTASPDAGDYGSDQFVTLSSSDLGSGLRNIYYTLDGTSPNTTKTLYTGAVTIDKDTTIKAIAYDNAGNASGIMTAVYEIAPVISGETSVSITETTATINWTTDDLSTSRVVYDTTPHSTLGTAPDYGYTHSTIEDINKVTSHSVDLTRLSAGTVYYYRTISHGSPETVGDEQTFTTVDPPSLTVTTSNGGSGVSDGLGCANHDCSTHAPGQVLGISTQAGSWPKLAYVDTNIGTGDSEDGNDDVLGVSTGASPEPNTTYVPTAQSPEVGTIKWVLTHKKISLGVVLVLLAAAYGTYLFVKKNK